MLGVKKKGERTMKQYYPAVFTKETDGQYSVSFPDLPEAITCGENLEHAIEMATECLGLCLVGRKEDGDEIPLANFEGIKTNENEIVVGITFDSVEFSKKYNNKSIRKNVTIPAWLNDLAEKDNINFSNVLQNALIKILNI